MAKAILKRGQGQISVSFSGLQLYEGMQRDGPYHVAAGLALLTGRIASAADGRNGNKLTTGPYRRDSWDRGSFHGTAKISGQGVDLKGDGKFQIYRVRWDVVTPGGNCSWGGYLTPEARSGSDAFGTWKKRLAPGPTTLEFDFDGYFINKAGGQQAWKLSAPHVECDGKPIPTTRESSNLIDLDTGILRAEDFEPIPTGFRIQPAAVELKMRAGGTTQVFLMTIERIGRFTEPVTLRLSGVPTTVTARVYDAGNRDNASIYFYASALAKGGEYPIHVVAAGGGKEHEFDVRLVVDAPVTLVTSRLEPCPPVAPVTGPVTRKSVMLVLGANSTMRGLGCDAAKQFAQRFKEGLRPGLDALGIVEFNTSVHVALPLTSDFEAPAQKASEEFARVQCSGWSSTAYALEKAHAQLKRDNAKDSERVVVMVFSIQPTAIAAKWAVRTKADSRRQLYGAQVELPPSNCPDSLGRRYPQPGWATGDSMPDRIGALGGGGPFRVYGGPLAPAEGPLDESVLRFPVASRDRCGFSNGVPLIGDPNTEPLLLQDLAYLPETDLGGVPLDGPRRLARFENGPYSGKIRPDSQENRRAALNNLFEKALQRLVNDGVRVIAAHVSTYNDPKGLASIFNLAESPSFDARKQAGMLIAIHDGEQVLPMLERIWEALGITRRL